MERAWIVVSAHRWTDPPPRFQSSDRFDPSMTPTKHQTHLLEHRHELLLQVVHRLRLDLLVQLLVLALACRRDGMDEGGG